MWKSRMEVYRRKFFIIHCLGTYEKSYNIDATLKLFSQLFFANFK